MRAVVQRVDGAAVTVGGETVGEITGQGLCVLVGATHADTPETAARMARKLWTLRVLEGEKSCSDVGAPLLVVSQFTLYGDARKGRRPTWQAAAPGELAEPLVEAVCADLRALGAEVATGLPQPGGWGCPQRRRHGGTSQPPGWGSVSLTNDGPFTVLLEID
ncbi:D-aminoacyl-tRNA deacylase [Streptomyces sp. DSM 44917]|uniref:D-aminoacyl-tRNA deacylase n=1 Tax=Streptomyces boetiae TaxID=3075541 RepID=A0ABU2L1X7_9ACTN|nr:D-aminoacyl-tRNA deacylase [Streptomyces sp. DSM 44917]MDT0305556.1 D-aminoacyl-tRNA deacylase [Streptomyces sp. DSM 44917]